MNCPHCPPILYIPIYPLLQPWDFFYFFANNDSIERRILSGGNLRNLHEIAVKINFDLGFLRVLAQFLISFFLQLYLTWKNPWPQKKSLSCRQRRHEVYLDKGQKISESIFLALILPKTNVIIFPITTLAYEFWKVVETKK